MISSLKTRSSDTRTNPLPEGKLPIDVLLPLLKSLSERKGNGRVLVPPSIGVDVGVTKTNGEYLVVSSDPITGTIERIGWHAVNVSANDIATSGIMPEALTVVSLFPNGYGADQIMRISREIDSTARDLGIVVVGGHTEITPGLKRPIIVVTCFGSGDRFVTASMAKEGDSILMTKTAGIEGTSILARLDHVRKELGPVIARRASKLIDELSVIPEARAAAASGVRVHAMHDTTEGGLIGCLVEMSIASKLGFELDEKAIPIDDSTKQICRLISLDPLKLIGSGSLIIACSSRDQDRVIESVSDAGISCTRIGRFVSRSRGRVLLLRDGSKMRVTDVSIQDELWRALSEYGNLS